MREIFIYCMITQTLGDQAMGAAFAKRQSFSHRWVFIGLTIKKNMRFNDPVNSKQEIVTAIQRRKYLKYTNKQKTERMQKKKHAKQSMEIHGFMKTHPKQTSYEGEDIFLPQKQVTVIYWNTRQPSLQWNELKTALAYRFHRRAETGVNFANGLGQAKTNHRIYYLRKRSLFYDLKLAGRYSNTCPWNICNNAFPLDPCFCDAPTVKRFRMFSVSCTSESECCDHGEIE